MQNRGLVLFFLVAAAAGMLAFEFGCGSPAHRSPGGATNAAGSGIEPALREKLTQELIRLGKIDPITHADRVASAPPAGEFNRPQLGGYSTAQNGALTVSFIGRLSGDYDLSGEVSVADITPVALLFLQTVSYDPNGNPYSGEDNERRAAVDGDKSGEISIADITSIAMNYLNTLSGYNLYRDGVFIPNAINPLLPSLPRPGSGDAGFRDGRWPVYVFSENPGGLSRQITYTLRPVDAGGVEGEAYSYPVNYIYNPDTTPPAAPANLTVTQIDSATLRVDWNDNIEPDLAGYSVYRSDNPADPAPVKLNGAALITGSQYDVTDGVTPGAEWYFWATASDGASPANESGKTGPVYIMVQVYTPPPPPTGLVATPGDGQASLNWDDSIDPSVLSYNVYMSIDPLDPSPAKHNASPVPSSDYVAAPLTNGTTYYFWVTAISSAMPPLESSLAGPASAMPLSGLNNPPVAVATANPTNGAAPLDVQFSDDQSSDADGIILVYRWDFNDDGSWDTSGPVPVPVNFIYDTPGTYTARLQVEDDGGLTDDDTVTILVTPAGLWDTKVVASGLDVRSLSVAYGKDGLPVVAAGENGFEMGMEIWKYDGIAFKSIGYMQYGGRDGLELAISGDGKYYMGRVSWNAMFEDSGDFSYDIGAGWTDKSYGTITDNTKIAVGASDKDGAFGYQWLILPEYTLVHVGNEEFNEFGTGVFNPNVSNIAFESDSKGETWLCDPANWNWTRAEWDGAAWAMHTREDMDGNYGNIYRVEWLPALGQYCMAVTTTVDPPQLAWAGWNGSAYAFKSTSGISVLYATNGAAIGPDGEVYLFQIDGTLDPPFRISYFDPQYGYSVPQLALEGPIKDAVVKYAAMAVSPTGMATIAYYVDNGLSKTIYCATFPKPQLG